jgi:basic membrane lipoprotein Med (substrate-binding protein (PBP1-ABC) superfamily)
VRQGLHVGVVGPLDVRVAGAVVERGRLGDLAGDRLVLVSASSRAAAGVADAAAAHPETHYALVGESVAGSGLTNLAGIVLRSDQAARLGGVVAGLVVADEGARQPRVAWVGPEERPLATAFVEGVHDIDAGAVVLRQWSADRPAACKESALEAISRGATVVMAHRGLCAEAAVAGAHQQNAPGFRLADFELPSVAAAQVVRDAVNGIYHGGEDLVFGAASGAIGIRALDPRIPTAIAVRARTAAQQLSSGRLPTG